MKTEFEIWKEKALALCPAPFTNFEPNKYPPFMRKAISHWAKVNKLENPGYSAAYFREHVLRETFGAGVLDHWGRAVLPTDRPCFVMQPYGVSSESLIACERFAAASKLKFEMSAASEWYPGKTVSLIFS